MQEAAANVPYVAATEGHDLLEIAAMWCSSWTDLSFAKQIPTHNVQSLAVEPA